MQLGSLGSGNHFIEVTADEQRAGVAVPALRQPGRGQPDRLDHIAVAQKRAERDRLDLPERDLAWLDEGTREFDRYMAELQWAQHFALLNREEMMDRVADCLAAHMRVDATPRLERSTATTTSPRRRRTTACSCGCRGRARSRPSVVRPG